MRKTEAVNMFKEIYSGLIKNNPNEIETFWNGFTYDLYLEGHISSQQFGTWKLPKF